jgi:hypothetical protein
MILLGPLLGGGDSYLLDVEEELLEVEEDSDQLEEDMNLLNMLEVN